MFLLSGEIDKRREAYGKKSKRKHQRRKKETAMEVVPICPLPASSVGSLAMLPPCEWLLLLEGGSGLSFFQPRVYLMSAPLFLSCGCLLLLLGECSQKLVRAPPFSSLSARLLHAFLSLGSLWPRSLCAASWPSLWLCRSPLMISLTSLSCLLSSSSA